MNHPMISMNSPMGLAELGIPITGDLRFARLPLKPGNGLACDRPAA
jgi:hypothetical protein